MKRIFVLLCGLVLSANVWSQSSSDIYDPKVPVTWLGLDCTQLKIIGSASQWGSKSFISAGEVKNKYFPGWNHLFIDEQKKYDVAGVVERKTINYALEITEDANNNTDTNAIFTPNSYDYQLLTKEKIAELVSSYNFEGKPGIGLMIFMEGLSKSAEEGCGWLTFGKHGYQNGIIY
jgi:hypothetical protein